MAMRGVGRYLLRRGLLGIAVVLGVTTVVFFVTRVIADPAQLMLPIGAPREAYDALRERLGFDEPLLSQYVAFLGDLLRFDFGESLWQHAPARDVIFEYLPASFQLVSVGVLAAVVVFVPIGIVASLRPGGLVDRCVVTLSLAGVSLPTFWLGAILILLLSVRLGWLPTSGSGTPKHLVLPAVTLALSSGARIAQITRSALIDQLSVPYVTALRARGFSTWSILSRHVLRNAAVPISAIAFWEYAVMIAGESIILETVFAWPGLGYLIVQSINRQDLILLQSGVFVAALIVVGVNLLADLVLKMVDPRIDLA
jgi:peptide/nickel transport system permease protein